MTAHASQDHDSSSPDDQSSRMGTGEVVVRGLLAGAAGVAAMTLAEKIEQAFTGRPNSYVPVHTLERLLGLPKKPDSDLRARELAGALSGCLRRD